MIVGDRKLKRQLIVLLVAVVFPLKPFADTIANSISLHYPEYLRAHIRADADKARVARGEYLVKLGDCMACHTDASNGAPQHGAGGMFQTRWLLGM
jgi:mono/diheme cytochrome c family protein